MNIQFRLGIEPSIPESKGQDRQLRFYPLSLQQKMLSQYFLFFIYEVSSQPANVLGHFCSSISINSWLLPAHLMDQQESKCTYRTSLIRTRTSQIILQYSCSDQDDNNELQFYNCNTYPGKIVRHISVIHVPYIHELLVITSKYDDVSRNQS